MHVEICLLSVNQTLSALEVCATGDQRGDVDEGVWARKLLSPGSSAQDREHKVGNLQVELWKYMVCFPRDSHLTERKKTIAVERLSAKGGLEGNWCEAHHQWWDKKGKESVQVVNRILPRSPPWVLFCLESDCVKKTPRNTNHICLCMSWAADGVRKLQLGEKRQSFQVAEQDFPAQTDLLSHLWNIPSRVCLKNQRKSSVVCPYNGSLRVHWYSVLWPKHKASSDCYFGHRS